MISLHTREGQGERQTLRWYFATKTGCRLQTGLFCQLASFFNRTVHLHTLHVWHKTGSPPSAQDSMARLSGHQTPWTWIHWIIMSGELMIDLYHTFQSKQKSIDNLKDALQSIWNELPLNSINKAVLSFTRTLQVCVEAGGRHIEHFV